MCDLTIVDVNSFDFYKNFSTMVSGLEKAGFVVRHTSGTYEIGRRNVKNAMVLWFVFDDFIVRGPLLDKFTEIAGIVLQEHANYFRDKNPDGSTPAFRQLGDQSIESYYLLGEDGKSTLSTFTFFVPNNLKDQIDRLILLLNAAVRHLS